MERRLQQIFFALSMLALALILAAEWQAHTPSWKNYQRNFLQIEAQDEPNAVAKAAVLATPPEIHQVMLTGLQRVDRCTTCHLGVDDPTLKNAPEPFRYHDGLGPHIASKFGCTICHGGQGLATDKQSAHGDVAFWPNPLLSADYVRAACGRCHKEGDVPGVPELAEGRHLFENQGCRGCHKLNGVGGSIGPDLSEEGASLRPPEWRWGGGPPLFENQGGRGCHKLNGVGGSIGPDLSEEGASLRPPEWLEKHFLAPNEVSSGSAMPNFHFTREQARALTYYMLSLTNEDMGSYYASVRLIPSPEYGRELFVEKNCIACHNVGGVGAKTGPDLLGVTKRHSPEWLDEQLVNPQLVHPGSSMPEYDLETNARKALLAFMTTATPDDAQSILSGRKTALKPEDVAIEAGKQDFARFGC